MVDSTPVECARSTETVKRSDLAGWAQYGYCASHSRYFWGLRLHLLCTVHGLPLGWALTGAKADERDVSIEILSTTSTPVSNTRESATIIGDKNYYGRAFEATLADQGITLLRPARKGETPSPGHRFFKPLRQIIESVNDTLKGQLDLEHHQGRTIAGVCTRIGQRILALTAAIWHNDRIGHTIRRSLTPYDPLTPWNQSSTRLRGQYGPAAGNRQALRRRILGVVTGPAVPRRARSRADPPSAVRAARSPVGQPPGVAAHPTTHRG